MKQVIVWLFVILLSGVAYSASSKDKVASMPTPVAQTCKAGIRVHRHRISGDGKFEIYTFAIRTGEQTMDGNCYEVLTQEYEFKKPVPKDAIKGFEKTLLATFFAKPSPAPTPALDIEK